MSKQNRNLECVLSIGTTVCKRSRKPFPNGRRCGIVERISNEDLPNIGLSEVVYIIGCDKPVRSTCLTTDTELITILQERDKN